MQIKLTEGQMEKVALAWLNAQRVKPEGYRKVLKALFGRYAGWDHAWNTVDAVAFAARMVSKDCCLPMTLLKERMVSK